ncbi:hypothetical protein [Indiicoccus explosivorum]|nr:hypothetical protein [Indiicoccus explosivorum]
MPERKKRKPRSRPQPPSIPLLERLEADTFEALRKMQTGAKKKD